MRLFNLGPVDRIPLGEGRTFSVDGREVAVFRTRDGGIFATQARCPHKQGPLADGILGPRTVTCPLHAFTFELSTGKPVSAACEKLAVYPVGVNEVGEILLRWE